jgi:phage terminase large subunit-like protein
VFLAAKDGNQARDIAGKHAIEMVRSSQELSAECVPNMSRMSITHTPSRSLMMPLSSSGETNKQSKEGINGSVIIDETHVVDEDFMARIKRAGISRSEPVHAEFSTAGKDPGSYGKSQYDYGKEVIEGKRDDPNLLFVSCEAPQTLTDEELAADPVKYGRMANPAWGHTVGEEEFLADYRTSAVKVTDLADFKTYRLDIWQKSANPWLKASHWENCRRDFTAESLSGGQCAGGLDMGKSDDMTAFALVFPEDMDAWFANLATPEQRNDGTSHAEERATDSGTHRSDVPVYALVWYWMTDEAVQKIAVKEVRLPNWVQQGFVKVTSGAAIDYAVVEDDIGALLSQYSVGMIGFDERYATRSMQFLVTNHGLPESALYIFNQSWRQYTGPCNHFERLVSSGKLWHNGNPVTDWQAGHVLCPRRSDDSMKPMKPGGEHDHRKIDGIQAIIMGLDAAARMPNTGGESYYATHGAEFA